MIRPSFPRPTDPRVWCLICVASMKHRVSINYLGTNRTNLTWTFILHLSFGNRFTIGLNFLAVSVVLSFLCVQTSQPLGALWRLLRGSGGQHWGKGAHVECLESENFCEKRLGRQMEEGKTCTVIGNEPIFPIVLSRNLICSWANYIKLTLQPHYKWMYRWSFTCSWKRCFRIGGCPANTGHIQSKTNTASIG